MMIKQRLTAGIQASGLGIVGGGIVLLGLFFLNKTYATRSKTTPPVSNAVSKASPVAIAFSPSPATTPSAASPIASRAKETFITSHCPSGKKIFTVAETTNFLICIYGDDRPSQYFGKAKKDGNSISLPLTEVQGNRFIAKNMDVSYILTPNSLMIMSNGSAIQTDPMVFYE
jgi:hypothetical protein